MSKYELKKTIQKELRELNWRIDMKILRGLSYREDARRHKLLVMQLDRIRTQRQGGIGFLGKMAGALTSFVL